jgi:hypothetical protein
MTKIEGHTGKVSKKFLTNTTFSFEKVSDSSIDFFSQLNSTQKFETQPSSIQIFDNHFVFEFE